MSFYKEELKKKKMFKEVLLNKDAIKIWKKLDNGCYIGTINYTKENVHVLLKLLKSFEEQYGEVIDYKAAEEELKFYHNDGICFIYFDEFGNPVSMNGCGYNYNNDTVDFYNKEDESKKINSLYFYGLSTVPEYRRKGACGVLIDFALEFAKYNEFDLVYARTDLVGSNSEKLMENAGLEVCKDNGFIIAEWVDVTETQGDHRLHMWLPLNDKVSYKPKGDYLYATDDGHRKVHKANKVKAKGLEPNYKMA